MPHFWFYHFSSASFDWKVNTVVHFFAILLFCTVAACQTLMCAFQSPILLLLLLVLLVKISEIPIYSLTAPPSPYPPYTKPILAFAFAHFSSICTFHKHFQLLTLSLNSWNCDSSVTFWHTLFLILFNTKKILTFSFSQHFTTFHKHFQLFRSLQFDTPLLPWPSLNSNKNIFWHLQTRA